MSGKPKFKLDPADPMLDFFIKGFMAANKGKVPSFEELNLWLSLEIEKTIADKDEDIQ